MYRILTEKEENTILLPATLDSHFPLLRYMFWRKGYSVVPLEDESEFDVREEGLKYSNPEICYPFVLMTGQVVRALKSGKYDPKKTFVLMPTAGDACRGACYIGLMKKALERSGYSDVRVLTINVRHVRDDISLPISLDMAVRGLFGLFYSDMLMLLANQTRPYEINKGETDELVKEWTGKAAEDIKLGRHLTLHRLRKNMKLMADSFARIEKTSEKKQAVGIVAEFYVKYCALGNWDIVKYLEENGCEAHVNGASWYFLYYIDSHKPARKNLERLGFEIVKKLLRSVQDSMIKTLRSGGFRCLSDYNTMDMNSRDYVSHTLTIGDGWLMGAETVDYINNGIPKVLCIAPFGCMANVCAGRGLYPALQRRFPGSSITVVETDASGSKMNYYNRVQMLIHFGKKAP